MTGTLGGVDGGNKAIVSRIGGGCGATIPYVGDHYSLVKEEGEVWCGMEYKQLAGHYLICMKCYMTND